MTSIWVESVSVFGPGLLGWPHASEVLGDPRRYDPQKTPPIESRFLSPNNRRRTSPHMQIAIQAADYALRDTGFDETSIDLILTSSEEDLDIAEDDIQALVQPEKEISPQKFQNVILNAAAGHLGIFMKNTSGSTTVSGTGNCFSVGLLQAYTTILATKGRALLVAYDAPSSMPYSEKDRPFFAVGMVLSHSHSPSILGELSLTLGERKELTVMEHPALETMRATTPSATGLPLLLVLAKKQAGVVELYYSKELSLTVALCF
ncbi:MAG TPA: beta-ketoacyl synthase chain length factor [Myxococcota bacterium]|nr:beta-ketoacyl synthase chain length factor [Myxococcota bacterium]